MSGEAHTLIDVYRAIEEQFATYGEKSLSVLVKGRGLTTEDLYAARGKVQATEEILRNIRNTLGYDPHSL